MSWFNFFECENIIVDPKDWHKLEKLNEELIKLGSPKRKPFRGRIESRKLLCQTAIENSIDISSFIHIGRGLLDVWNEEYKRQFGSNIGTTGLKESLRRNIKSKLNG